MMPAKGRNTAAPSLLPPVDSEATVPFSELFNTGFDRATIDAAAQFTDRSIFVAPNGRRYRIEPIDDQDFPAAATAASTAAADSTPASAPAPVPPALSAAADPVRPPAQPTAYHQISFSPHSSPSIATIPSTRVGSSLPNSLGYTVSATWGRSPSDASYHSYSSGGYSTYQPQPQPPTSQQQQPQQLRPPGGRGGGGTGGGTGGEPPREAITNAQGTQPKSPAHEVTTMMTHLNITNDNNRNHSHFGANPLYGLSDGGVQAAEALTDPYVGVAPGSLTSPRLSVSHHEQPQQSPRSPYDNPSTAPVSWTDVDYVNYTQQANYHVQTSRQMATAGTGLPSLMGEAIPIVSTSPASSPLLPHPHLHRPSDPLSPGMPPISPEKEFYEGPPNGGYYYPPQSSSFSSSSHNPHLAVHSAPPSITGRSPSYATIGSTSGIEYDTLTPVVVYPSGTAPSMSSDGASTGRDNVLPGEDLVFDGPVKSAHSLTNPAWQEGILKVFRNNLTNDLRFHCKAFRESETYWMKAANAQLVPAYAYDPRLQNVVYIRDKESDKGAGYMQAAQGTGRPSGIYQFAEPKELFDFQARLTSHKVVLDIQSIKLVTLNKSGSREIEKHSGARLQIWHETNEGGNKSKQSDVASFVTAGTALSGPLRERQVVNSSRLMVYLGRLGEYITLMVTDDLDIKPDGQATVKIKPRKGPTPFSRRASRWPGVKAHIEKSNGTEPAALDIHGLPMEVNVDKYDLYKTFEIEFENSPSQDYFVRKWDEVIKERRKERHRLQQIQEEMEGAVFTGRSATRVIL